MAITKKPWLKNPEFFQNKTLKQIINFMITETIFNKQSINDIREFFSNISSDELISYAQECMDKPFDDSCYVLQDIVNEIGKRLSFKVEHGLYKGVKNRSGHDGLWTTADGYSLIIEVKSTTTYNINLSAINNYRHLLCKENKIDIEKSSILLVIGKGEKTASLEEQIRGSRYAWNIRLISLEALIKLLQLKEKFNDISTLQKICEILKPLEYTKVDRLIDTVFLTAEDAELDELDESNGETTDEISHRANFYVPCIDKLETHFNKHLIKSGKTLYGTADKDTGVFVLVSKTYHPKNPYYWFALHPHQEENLKEYQHGYIAYGCGSEDNLFLIPIEIMSSLKENLNATVRKGKIHWHIKVDGANGFHLQIPKASDVMDMEAYRI